MMSENQRRYQTTFNRQPWRQGTYFTASGNLYFDPRSPEFSSLTHKTDTAMRRICNITFPRPVVIYCPAGSGKARNAEALRKLFGKARVIEAPEPQWIDIPFDALIMTSNMQWASSIGSADVWPVVHITTALRAIGISSN